MGTPQPAKIMSDYLLGRLSEAEQEQFEEAYFNDNDAFIELLETEDKLIKDYLLGKLSPDVRELFESKYLSMPCKREMVEFAKLLNQPEAKEIFEEKSKAPTQNDSPFLESVFSFLKLKKPTMAPLAALASLLLISAIVWTARNYIFVKSPSEIARMSTPAPSLQPVENVAQQVIGLYLTPGNQRSSGNTSSLPTAITGAGEQQIELKLKVVGYVYPKYRGLLQKIDDGIKEIARNDSLKAESIKDERVVLWKLEAVKLPIGDYLIELQGVKAGGDTGDTNTYDFNVRGR